jgi:hypothetical protein
VQAAMLGGGKGKGGISSNTSNGKGGGGTTRGINNNGASNSSSSTTSKQQPYPSTASLLSAFRERLSRINSEEGEDDENERTGAVNINYDKEAKKFLEKSTHHLRPSTGTSGSQLPLLPPPPAPSSSSSSFNQFSKYSSLQALGIDAVLDGGHHQQQQRRSRSLSPSRQLSGNLPPSHTNQYLGSLSPSSYNKLDVDELRRAAKQVSQDALRSVAEDVMT